MNNNIEINLYERLGIKNFRKMVFAFREILCYPITRNMTKEERRQALNKHASNYNLGKVNTIEDVKAFKKQLALNTGIHIIGLLVCLSDFPRVFGGTCPIPSAIVTLSCTVLNTYCIMLQRYNLIRMNQYVEARNNRQKNTLKELEGQVQKETTLLQEQVKETTKGKDISKYIEKANKEQLLECREYILNSCHTRERKQEEKILKKKFQKER